MVWFHFIIDPAMPDFQHCWHYLKTNT